MSPISRVFTGVCTLFTSVKLYLLDAKIEWMDRIGECVCVHVYMLDFVYTLYNFNSWMNKSTHKVATMQQKIICPCPYASATLNISATTVNNDKENENLTTNYFGLQVVQWN